MTQGKLPATGNSSLSSEAVSLEPWEELVGELRHIDVDETRIVVELSTGTLVVGVPSREAKLIQRNLVDCEGTHVSILRTDSPETPIRISCGETS